MKNISFIVVIGALFGNLSVARAGAAAVNTSPATVIDVDVETPRPTTSDEGGSDQAWSDAADSIDMELGDGEPGDGVKAGVVLYKVYWEGHGFTTVVADYYFYRQWTKVAADCAAAGGELKNIKTDSHGIGWYKDEGWADCVKK